MAGRQREVPAGEARIAIARPARRPCPARTRAGRAPRRARARTASAASSSPSPRPRRPWNRTIARRRQAARRPPGADRASASRSRRASGGSGTFGDDERRPIQAPPRLETLGQRIVDRDDRVGGARPAGLASARCGGGRARDAERLVRLERRRRSRRRSPARGPGGPTGARSRAARAAAIVRDPQAW